MKEIKEQDLLKDFEYIHKMVEDLEKQYLGPIIETPFTEDSSIIQEPIFTYELHVS